MMLDLLAEVALDAGTRKSRFFRWFNIVFFLLLLAFILVYWRELV
jgi:hypothetical protein